jgi:hypothetical protein
VDRHNRNAAAYLCSTLLELIMEKPKFVEVDWSKIKTVEDALPFIKMAIGSPNPRLNRDLLIKDFPEAEKFLLEATS